jgi:hypothetical protein
MRKLFVIALLVVMGRGVALAGDPDVGCGWGTQAFRGKSGVAYKVMAATTNGSLGSQTFGISSGTAGCGRGGIVKAEARVTRYAAANIDSLAADMAAGGGESLDTLSGLMGVADGDKPAFHRLAKANFAALFPSDQVSAGEMLDSLIQLMAADQQLAKYVS